MLRAKTILSREPRWRKCETCRAQFCVATRTFKKAGEIAVRFCPNCGADAMALQRWILGYPLWPDDWC